MQVLFAHPLSLLSIASVVISCGGTRRSTLQSSAVTFISPTSHTRRTRSWRSRSTSSTCWSRVPSQCSHLTRTIPSNVYTSAYCTFDIVRYIVFCWNKHIFVVYWNRYIVVFFFLSSFFIWCCTMQYAYTVYIYIYIYIAKSIICISFSLKNI